MPPRSAADAMEAAARAIEARNAEIARLRSDLEAARSEADRLRIDAMARSAVDGAVERAGFGSKGNPFHDDKGHFSSASEGHTGRRERKLARLRRARKGLRKRQRKERGQLARDHAREHADLAREHARERGRLDRRHARAMGRHEATKDARHAQVDAQHARRMARLDRIDQSATKDAVATQMRHEKERKAHEAKSPEQHARELHERHDAWSAAEKGLLDRRKASPEQHAAHEEQAQANRARIDADPKGFARADMDARHAREWGSAIDRLHAAKGLKEKVGEHARKAHEHIDATPGRLDRKKAEASDAMASRHQDERDTLSARHAQEHADQADEHRREDDDLIREHGLRRKGSAAAPRSLEDLAPLIARAGESLDWLKGHVAAAGAAP